MDFTSPDLWISLLTLSALEIVLGLDNIIFISILAGRLPAEQRARARRLGLMGAFVTRLGLLAGIAWIVRLDTPLFEVFNIPFSGKSLILLVGGLFLLYKATKEIHHKLEGEGAGPNSAKAAAAVSFGSVIFQIVLLDLVFSVDSVITAVGLTPYVSVMIAANIIALAIMLLSVTTIGAFVERHPTVKVLALSFLLMIGLVLMTEGLGFHIPKGYVYFAMGFSIFVETINIRIAKHNHPVALNTPKIKDMIP